ncbi:MAG: sensor histidine kinase [Candidatus Dormibacteraceae bacterium]
MFRHLRRRLALINFGVVLLVIALLAGGALAVLDRLLTQQESGALQGRAQTAARELSEHGDLRFRSEHAGYAADAVYLIWSTGGRLLFNPGHLPASGLRGAAVRAAAGRGGVAQLDLSGQEVLVDSELVKDGGGQTAVLQVEQSLAPVRRVEQEALMVLIGVAVVGLVLSWLAAWLLAGRALVPVQAAFERQRRFTSDASHELRTPLTIVDAALQVLSKHPEQTIDQNAEEVRSAAAEVTRMGRLIDDLLTLARADSDQLPLRREPVDLDSLVRQAAADMSQAARGQGSAIHLGHLAGGWIEADPDRLRQLLLILLDNAASHTPAGTRIDVSVTRSPRSVVLDVADDGPGIPEQMRPHAFQRFHRLRDWRSTAGAGLGLAIARWLVDAHKGQIHLLENQPGLLVRVILPTDHPPSRKPIEVGRHLG